MRDRGMAKLFSFSCISVGAAALPAAAEGPQKPSKAPELVDPAPPPLPPSEGEELESGKKRHSMIHKFAKSFSHLFSLAREDDDGEEEEREMVIGFPTDVQHVAHIGWDGFAGATTAITGADAKKKSTTATDSSWAKGGPELLALDSLSLKQFHTAMETLRPAGCR